MSLIITSWCKAFFSRYLPTTRRVRCHLASVISSSRPFVASLGTIISVFVAQFHSWFANPMTICSFQWSIRLFGWWINSSKKRERPVLGMWSCSKWGRLASISEITRDSWYVGVWSTCSTTILRANRTWGGSSAPSMAKSPAFRVSFLSRY